MEDVEIDMETGDLPPGSLPAEVLDQSLPWSCCGHGKV